MTDRPGTVRLPELILVFWVFALVLGGLAELVAGQGRLAGRQRALVRLQEAHRTTEIILGRELRALPAAAVRRDGGETLGLRAVRGSGPICSGGDRVVSLRYAGPRRPDPDKDSVLVFREQGEEVRAVVAVTGGACGGRGVRLTLDRPLSTPHGFGFAFVFEPGSYHAAEGAVRYLSGGAGRQPLTEALFRRTVIAPGQGAAGIRVFLEPRPDSLAPGARSPTTLHIPSLNPEPS